MCTSKDFEDAFEKKDYAQTESLLLLPSSFSPVCDDSYSFRRSRQYSRERVRVRERERKERAPQISAFEHQQRVFHRISSYRSFFVSNE